MFSNVYEQAALHNRVFVFRDREQAGAAVAGLLESELGPDATDTVIYGIPAGGIPVAAEAARLLGVPLDFLCVSKITLPWNTEAGYGAVAGESAWKLNERVVRQAGLSESTIREGLEQTKRKVARRTEAFRRLIAPHDARGKTAVLVDDGVASGFTMRVAIEALRTLGPKLVAVAVPTAHSDAVNDLARGADRVYCANVREGTPFAVADAYENWSDVSEDEVTDILRTFDQPVGSKTSSPGHDAD